ncbi:RNA polymerase sigma factor [Actinomadura sp. HBU206391]|uniref:RNA polymerase sigma factor n=1 Tax=Actinomadura sp. HBU206391 TaxID=2731692 RepID=UPI00164F875C|nr:RNA polymerase sigma factor [Actinomadura sp. HBU206391]MBC6459261.1 RNA polymerase sigma factor [Actinomadura sp. HBU206391]
MAFDERTEALAVRAAQGDQAALNDLLRAIEPDVMRHSSRFLPCRQDAEEACQDALLQVARNIGKFEGRSRFSTWLHVVVANSARSTYRSLKRRSVEQVGELPQQRPDPHRTSVIAGSRVDILDAMEELEARKPDLIQALVLRDVSQLEYSEIAEQLGLPLGTVKSRIHEARKQFRQTLGESY